MGPAAGARLSGGSRLPAAVLQPCRAPFCRRARCRERPLAALPPASLHGPALPRPAPCTQVADLRGSTKALAVGGDVLYVGGQSCQVSAYRLAPELLDAPGPPSGGAPISADPLMRGPGPQQGSRQQPPPAAYTVPDGAEAAAAAGCPPCGGGGIRAVVGTAQPPCAASPPEHSHCGSITALAVCGPFVFSASSDSTIRVWRAGGLEFVRVLRGHRGSVLALYGGGGVVLRWARRRAGACGARGWALPCWPGRGGWTTPAAAALLLPREGWRAHLPTPHALAPHATAPAAAAATA